MYKHFRALAITFLFLFASYGYGQEPPVVALDLDAGTMGAVPFDQHFKLGSFKTAYDKITLTYKINEKYVNKSPNYFTGGAATFQVNKLTGMATCPDLINPLHPNVLYDFDFTVEKAIILTELEEAALKKEIFELILTHFKDVQAQDGTTTSNFKTALKAILVKYAKSNVFLDSGGAVIDIGTTPLFTGKLHESIFSVEKASFNLDNTATGLKVQTVRAKDNAVNFINGGNHNAFFAKLGSALADTKVSASFKKMLDSPVNPSIKGNETLGLRQYLLYLLEDPSKRMVEILEGKKKIIGNTHIDADALDINSLILLSQAFEILNRSSVKDSNNHDYFTGLANTSLDGFQRRFDAYLEKVRAKEKELAAIKEAEANIPNLLKGAFLRKEINVQGQAFIDVLAEKNPYIGLDAGVGYAFGNAAGVFIYEGANFYLRPINRATHIPDLQGWDRFFKCFSIYLGIAQIVTEEEKSFKNLFGNNNLMVGTGYRFNRAFRLNVGGLLHYTKDPNPVVDDKKITVSPTVSISVDIDLIKALGAVGSALNIK